MEALKSIVCLNCGGEVEISDGGKEATCRYCKRKYKIGSTLKDSALISFSLATEYWKNFHFQKAKEKFLDVAKNNPEFSEAWWGAFVSEYGIEFGYNRFGDKVPTCHRAHPNKVGDDQNYIKAVGTADEANKEEYVTLGNEIERIRAEIIKKSEDGESYDIFICFKATEINAPGKKTDDYYLGQDIYHELKREGYNVFFSAETLARIGEQEFEPYIFKALSTAKVMLVLCSDNEKIESAWVKNEWGRFIDMRGGKGLIPICGNSAGKYSPSSLPDDLRRLNAIEYDGKLFERLKTKIEAYFPERVKARTEAEKKAREAEYEARFAKEREELKKQQAEFEALKKQMQQGFDASRSEPAITIYDKNDLVIKNGILKGVKDYVKEDVKPYSVVIPNSVTSIGIYAFWGCTGLTSVTLPNSVTNIIEAAFCGCDKIVEVINNSSLFITKGSEDYGNIACNALEVHNGKSKIVNKNGYLFYTYKGVNYLIDYIGNDIVLTLPENYNGENYEIYKLAFKNKNITSVTIPDSVTSIGEGAFIGCCKLVEVINKSSLTITKGNSGNGDVANYALEVHDGESKIVNKNGYLFYTYEGVNYLVNYIGNDAALTLPESYNRENYKIYNHVFDYNNITSVIISYGVTSIGAYAFNNCEELTSITILNSITDIGDFAFRGCTGLTSITIPNSVTSIGEDAFRDCTGLTSITIPDSVTSIGKAAFNGCAGLTAINVSNPNTSYKSVNGDLYTKDGKTLMQYAIGKTNTSFVIPMGVGAIGKGAFEHCKGLTSITIPDSVMSIDIQAFAFCWGLKTINYHGTSKHWKKIKKGIFWNSNTGSYTINYNYTGE